MLDKYLGEVVFVEVKTRTESEGLWGDIEGETLDEDQVNRITEAMSAYMARHSLMLKRLGVRRCKLELVEVKIVRHKGVGGRVVKTVRKSGIQVGRSVLLKRGLEV
jgi:Holliday junction resolvase-like predicted endonuclease